MTLATDGIIKMGIKDYKKGVIIPFDPSRPQLDFRIYTKEGKLWLWNSWQYRDTSGILHTSSQLNFAGMLVEQLSNGFRYKCNEGRDDDDYNDLIFRIERSGSQRS